MYILTMPLKRLALGMLLTMLLTSGCMSDSTVNSTPVRSTSNKVASTPVSSKCSPSTTEGTNTPTSSSSLNPAPHVIPSLQQWQGERGSFSIYNGSHIVLATSYVTQLSDTAKVFQKDVSDITGYMLPIINECSQNSPGSGNLLLTLLKNPNSKIGEEGYILDIHDHVTISANTSKGVFYGTRTVLQILRQYSQHLNLPHGIATDYPNYKERGFMLDAGRKFFPIKTPENIKTLEGYVRMMSWYKLNDFHIHLNDDANGGTYAAFCLNSPKFLGLAKSNCSYTQKDIRELQDVAKMYAVTITPEIDTPAHAAALTRYKPSIVFASDQTSLDLGNTATAPFVESLWNEFLPWFDTQEVSIGADEYSNYTDGRYTSYVNTLYDYLKGKGKTVRVWGSPGTVGVNKDIIVNDWNNDQANPVDVVDQGHQIINTNDRLLYIVPHNTVGYHDFLDTQTLYNQWEPNIFSLEDPSLNLKLHNPKLLGAMFAEWNDMTRNVTDDDVYAPVKDAMPALGEKMWRGVSGTSYGQFKQTVTKIGDTPAA